MKLKVINFALPVLLASCGKPVSLTVSYPNSPPNNRSITIVPSRPITGTKLLVNSQMVVANDSQRVKSITVKNLPSEVIGYQLTCDNYKLKQKLDASNNVMVHEGEARTFLHEVPPYSNGYWVKEGLENAAVWFALLGIYIVLD